jgi:NADPH:quinone reductase-like Zn-dependent oxidoreductase
MGQAAAVPLAAMTALRGLRDHGRVEPEQRVLIIGASGGAGTFAVQIGKSVVGRSRRGGSANYRLSNAGSE